MTTMNLPLYRLLLKIKADIVALRSEMRSDILNLKAELIMWMTGLTIAQLLALVALLVVMR